MSTSTPVIFPVVTQHAEEAGFLWTQRRVAVKACNISLRHLARHDERLAAHIDGVRLARRAGETACSMQLQAGESGAMFVAVALLLAAGAPERLEPLLALSEAVPAMRSGLFAALGWSESRQLRGNVAGMLKSASPFRRLAGTVACTMHRVNPGIILGRCIEDPDIQVRARAMRAAGELGLSELVSRLAAASVDADSGCQFWAAWSAVLLGDRHNAHSLLLSLALSGSLERSRAFQLALMAMELSSAHGVLQQLAQDPLEQRSLIRGSAFVGDPRYVSWLISQMNDDKTARLAGEAFSLTTGADLTALNLSRKRPEDVEAGPNDNPDDPNVEMDEDDGLPWPDAVKIQAWWHANSNRFQPGTRYFMGEPLNRDNCLRVLKDGFQRQRIAAALYLSLLNPGTPLFEWRAPAWRQQRLLAQMT